MIRATVVPAAFAALLIFASCAALAGGPGLVGGPAVGNRAGFGNDAQAFIWNPVRMPIGYRIDPGPMAVSSSGTVIIDHAAGVQRVQNMFAIWSGVNGAVLSFTNAGPLLSAGSYTGGDVKTAAQFNALMGSCNSGQQSPVIFDADGKLIASLGLPPEVIGFNSKCALDAVNGYILSSAIVMNGQFQDRVSQLNSSVPNFELTASQFDQAITHEIGHFVGLDHSQINLNAYLQRSFPCDPDDVAGLPLMFPIAFCQARKDEGLPELSTDEEAWVSSLYPSASTAANYGTISGTIFWGDSFTPIQGVNVIVRQVDDPNTPEDESRRIAVSAVSGYLFTSNPGQSVTAALSSAEDNTNGSPVGSRNSSLIGYYQLSVTPGVYTVEVESVYDQFVGGSSVGPLDPPVPMPGSSKFWNQNGSPFDFPLQRTTITVHAGDKITGIDVILNAIPDRFDPFEDSGYLMPAPVMNSISPASDILS
jgi:hypothetical protein